MRKLFALFMVACMATGVAGCSKPEAKPAGSQEVDKTAEAQTTTETTAETTAQPIELTYWSMWNEAEPQGQVISEAAKQYMKDNKNVTININWQGREINKIIPAKLSAGEKIDLYDGPLNVVLPATADYAMDVTDYFKKSYPTTNGKNYEDVVLKATVDTTKVYSKEGQINGIPYQPYVQCMFYNKEHFEKAGITSVPATWDEFLAACEKLKTAGYKPITVDDAYMLALPGYYLAREKGGDWVSELVKENKDEMWQDPAVLHMAEAYADLAAKGYFHPNVSSNIFPAGQQDLANGEASMYLNATWLVNELMPVTGPDFPWGQFQFPSVAGGEGNPKAANYASQAFYINKDSANQEAAFDFIAYLTTGDWDGKIAEATYGIPSGLDSVWPKQLVDAKDVFVGTEEWLPWSGGMEDNGNLSATISAAFVELISGKITPQQFVDRMVGM
ncbi:MAG: ABC transporter substrate-binding protein [Cellulosilyticaceae bacterium]